jgi:hypothetical protein
MKFVVVWSVKVLKLKSLTAPMLISMFNSRTSAGATPGNLAKVSSERGNQGMVTASTE